MANPEHLDILKQGVEVWNKWRDRYQDIRPDLSGADFRSVNRGTNLSRVNFRGADLRRTNLSSPTSSRFRHTSVPSRFSVPSGMINFGEVNLSRADLSRADLRDSHFAGTLLERANLNDALLNGADLRCVDLLNADLQGADLYEADLRGADLRGADLCRANLSQAVLTGADLSEANLYQAVLCGADLRETKLNRAILSDADLTGCSVYGISAWDVQLEGAIQNNLVITNFYPTITVDNLEVAQFVYLLLNHKKLRDVLNSVTERGVLILGRFGGGGLEVLHAIAAKMREKNYLPIIFDFERPQDRNYTETVKTLAGLARFIIADLSGPSVPQELYATVPHFKIPFVPIIETGRKPFAMSVDLLEYPWVVRPPVTFATTEELLEQLPTKVIAPAEEKHQARQKLLDELFKKT